MVISASLEAGASPWARVSAGGPGALARCAKAASGGLLLLRGLGGLEELSLRRAAAVEVRVTRPRGCIDNNSVTRYGRTRSANNPKLSLQRAKTAANCHSKSAKMGIDRQQGAVC